MFDRMDLEFQLLIARRRADACTPGSPSWDAAMGLVVELEDELRRLDQPDDAQRGLLAVGQPSN
jgi:hypothetical protein